MSNNIVSNLPINNTTNNDSASDTKKFFNSYYNESILLSSNLIDATVGFFESKGFEKSAALSISSILLTQSRIEKVNVFSIIDTLKNLNDTQLSRVVSEILNYNRLNISALGYRVENVDQTQYELRNVLA